MNKTRGLVIRDFDPTTNTDVAPQGVITVNCDADPVELADRQQQPGMGVTAYPAGTLPNVHAINSGDPVFMNSNNGFQATVGRLVQVWGTLNGKRLVDDQGRSITREELEESNQFVGFARAQFDPDKFERSRSGVAVGIAGTANCRNLSSKIIHPFDTLIWEFPEPPSQNEARYINNGGTASYQNPTGVNRSAIKPVLVPLHPGNSNPGLDAALAKIRRPFDQGGVSDVNYEDIAGRKHMDASREHAASLFHAILMIGCRLHTYFNANYGAQTSLEIFTALQDTANANARMEIMRLLFPKKPATYGANGNAQIFTDLNAEIGAADLVSDTGRVRDNGSDAARYARAALDIPYLLEGSWLRAQHSIDHRKAGISLVYSTPNQNLDVYYTK